MTENWKTVRQHRREDVAREVDDFALGNEVEHLGLEHVDAGVDGVGEHLTPTRLLEKAFDGAIGVGDHDAELERVLDVLQGDGGLCTAVAVRLDERAEIDVGEDVTRDDEERVVELGGRVLHRTRGTER